MLKGKENIYFVGIGGIGMSALARYFHISGYKVGGYDRSITPLTKRLQKEGVAVTNFEDADAIPFEFRNSDVTLVVYTPAVPSENDILHYFEESAFDCIKRAEVLGELSKQMPTIAVAGTHGKTTISTMLAHLLHNSNIKCNAFLGGISRNLGTNLLLQAGAQWMITEADEYDRSFLQLQPQMAIVSSMDLDHMDIYANKEDMYGAYQKFVNQIDKEGFIAIKKEAALELELNIHNNTYALDAQSGADVYAKNIDVNDGQFTFDYVSKEHQIEQLYCGLPGLHNIENALAAIALVRKLGLTDDQIREGLSSFEGVQRRFDVHIQKENIVYIDDYAHHPSEINALHASVVQMFPDRKITAIFQPHLYSRTQDFADEFATALEAFDELILLEIYPAREMPIEGVDALWLSKKINKEGVHVCEKHHISKLLKSKELDLLVTMGAGDIDTLIHPIREYLEANY